MFLVILIAITTVTAATDYDFLDLPLNHLPYYFNTHVKVAEQCYVDDKCPHADYLKKQKINVDKCWGYEPYCTRNNAYWTVKCDGKLLFFDEQNTLCH